MADWPKETVHLGKSTRRVDAPQKVTGQAKYASDVQPEGWLYGMIFRSRWPAARVTKINLDKARALPGIKAAVLEGAAERRVYFYGQELAAVAGTSKQACLDALQAIEVEATPLPFVVVEEEALKPEAPQVVDGSQNLSVSAQDEKGEVDKAFAESDVIVEGFFQTPVQLHHPLETHGNTVWVKPDGIVAWASTQGISSVRDGLAGVMKIPQDRIQVLSEFMGGGFGAKFGLGVEGKLAAMLSKEAGLPVRIMVTRFDQGLSVGNRPSSRLKLRLGAGKDGKLKAFESEVYGTAGFLGGGSSEGGSSNARVPLPYIYQVANRRVKQSVVATNGGSGRAMRAPGHPQASFAMEGVMDDLAVKLGMDPIELRLLNDPFEIRQKEWRLGVEKFGWKEKYKTPGSSPGPVKTGIGCAAATWGGGGRGTQAQIQVNPDGSVEVRCGTQDLGTGTKTSIAVIAAEAFGLEPEMITPRIGDTHFPPSGGSGGSTTSASVAPAIWDTCEKALAELQKASGMADVRGLNWKDACKKLGVTPLVVNGAWRQGLSSSGADGVQFAEVEVDTETGFVKVRKVLCVQDAGLIINRLTIQSQMNGAVIMGMGFALYEERRMDRGTGVLLNPNLETYKLTNIADVPEIEVVLVDMPERGVIGVAEPAVIPTAAAIANAVANALGVRITSLPITPDKVLAALGKTGKAAA